MSGASIEAPYTIAVVPTPLDRTHGRIQAAPVFATNGSKKRKRSEVVVGIDGESVNIYSVRSHSLNTSYALPPQSYLCCPPASVYVRPTASTSAQRRTFAVIRDGTHSSRRRLLSFTENVRTKKAATSGFASAEKRVCKLADGEILSLDIISSESSNRLSIIATYTNGGIFFVSDDLSNTHWENSPAHNKDKTNVVEYAVALDVESARRGILRGREDIVAMLEHTRTQTLNSGLLCRLVRSDEERRLELYTVRDPATISMQTAQSPLQLLMDYTLPLQQQQRAIAAVYELHSDSGALYQLLQGNLNIFDLSGTVPRLVTELGSGVPSFTNFLRVSHSSVVAFSNGSATLFETSFGSVQASRAIPPASSSVPKGKKRKRDDDEEPDLMEPICAFPENDLVISLRGNDVVALQINDPLRESKTSKSHGALLSDVMGKGSSFRGVNDLKQHEHSVEAFETWTAKINALITEDDIEGLEKVIANDPELGRQRRESKRSRAAEVDDMPNGHTTPYQDLWPLPEAFDPEAIDSRKVLYILCRVFGRSANGDGRVWIRIPSLKLVEWLALTGFLSASYLQKAFLTNPSEDQAPSVTVRPGDIMIAIRHIDDDFQTIRDLLALPVQWDVAEVIQALRLVVDSFDASPTEERPLALPAPPVQSDGDTEMVNGDAKSDVEIETESKAAENELDFVINALTSGLEVRSDLLRLITLRLHAFPSSIITDTMRSMMSHSEVIFFIHILRIELADGGWTSKYIDAGDDDVQDRLVNAIGRDEESGGPSDQAIKAIGDLLNCAIDAIGTTGWLVGQSSSTLRTDELIASLRAEVSAGLEGCYEASTLETLLLELERCAASAGKPRAELGMHMNSTVVEINGDQSLLPLGSRIEPPAIPGRKGKGRHETKMAIGREKSKRVGKYSFERIRL